MDDFFVCAGSIFFFSMLFGFIALMRYMGYRETLALAEKGLVKPEKRNGGWMLGWGIGITSVGMALCIGLYPIGFWVGEDLPLRMGPWLLAGFIPMFFGLGLILTFVLTREPKKPADQAGTASLTPVAPILPPPPPPPPPPAEPPPPVEPPAVMVEPPKAASRQRQRSK